MSEEPLTLDKQPTGEISAVKPPTMNSLILDRITYLEATLADGLQINQWFAEIKTEQELARTRLDMMLILAAFNLTCIILTLIFFGFLFGKVTLP